MESIKKLLYNTIIGLSNALVRHTNKHDIILFNSFPDYSDNAAYLYRYIQKNRPDISGRYKLIWTGKQLPSDIDGHLGMNIVRKKSIKGYWLMLHARYIVITHQYYYGYISANGQCILNLWHGCGYKGMTDDDIKYRNGDYNIVTSDVFIRSHSRAFQIPAENILVTGLPRNDALFESGKQLLKKLDIDRDKYHKILIWMPTYRKAKTGHVSLDGDASGFGAYSMSRSQFEKINDLFQSNGYYLIIKPHPMDSATTDKANNLTNIKCITNEDLDKAHVALYSLLTETDVLLSDYSSIIVDYLLLDRPIVLVMSDTDAYKNSRGFTFENIDDYNPGPVISDFNGLYTYFDHLDEINKRYEEKRRRISGMLHRYHDGNSCKRVCDAIWGECNE